jgi:hypothetical protein
VEDHIAASADGRRRFPKAALLVPPLVPLVVVMLMALSGEFGSQGAGIHSSTGAVLSLLLLLSTIAAAIIAAASTQSAANLLAQYPALRNGANIACFAVAVLYLSALAIWVVVAVLV